MNTRLQKRIEEAAKALINYNLVDLGDLVNQYDLRRMLIEMGVKTLQNQWISVEEALPEEKFDNGYEFVFVIVKIDEETSYYDTDYIRNGKWELHDADKVTHWMNIPSLKGGEKCK